MRRPVESIREVAGRNIRWGVGWGLWLAGFFTIFAIIIFLTRGSRPFSNTGATLTSTILVYAFGGVAGGAIVGLLRPIARHAVGAMLVGLAAAFPVLFGVWLATEGMPSTWDHLTWLSLKVITGIAGPFFGLLLWFQAKTRGRL